MFGFSSEKTVTDKNKIDELLGRGVDRIYPTREVLEKVLLSGKRLRLYQGFDPTGDKLHLGHMVGLRKHRQWQDMGHEVIFLVGDGTGTAGDPTGKKKTREKFFTREELRENAKGYLNQASKVVRFSGPNAIKIMYNGDWLDKLTKVEILDIAQNFTVQQLIERDMFQERMKAGESINLREFLYPLLQGYDSVAMDVDLELGGTDQTFNMLAGRTLLKAMKGKEKFVMTVPLLSDSKGVKIGKSEGNVIGLTDEPNDLYGKIMSLPDDSIIPMFTLLTDVPLEEIKSFNVSASPMDLKRRVAHTIVSALHSKDLADKAQESFKNTFSKGDVPNSMVEVGFSKETKLMDALLSKGLVGSKTIFRRLVLDGAILDMTKGEKITNPDILVADTVYRVGKHNFIKIKVL